MQVRVKVYRLSQEGRWDDKGAGYVSVEFLNQCEAPGLVVVSEENHGKPLMVHRIRRDVPYHRQGEDTIISWQDPEFGTEVALSFQESVGCDSIWNELGALHPEVFGGGPGARRRGCVDEFESVTSVSGEEPGGPCAVELPPPLMANLEELARVLNEAGLHQREALAAQLLQCDYIPKVLKMFETCEDLEDRAALVNIYRVVRGMIMLTDSALLEELLKEQHVIPVVGALEYDPDVPVHIRHREFLRDKALFKEVVPVTDEKVKAKIHQTYRIQYLKDVILPRVLDDQAFTTMMSLVLFNNMDVVCALGRDEKFLPELFRQLQEGAIGDQHWADLVAFLQEFCSLLRHLQPALRQQLYAKLVELGLYRVLTRVMKEGKTGMRLKVADILLSAVQQDGQSLRLFLVDQPDHELFFLLVRELTEGADYGLSEQIMDVIRTMLDPETMDQGASDKKIIDIFYEKHLSSLVEALGSGLGGAGQRQDRCLAAPSRGLILELLRFCVQHHTYNIKYYVLKNNVLEKVLTLLRVPEKWLVVAALRFVRTCVAEKDDFYNRYLMRNNLFEPVVDLFIANGERYNLLNSTVIELMEFIRKENIKALIVHIVEKFYHKLQAVTYVDTFAQLKQKYDQSMERGGGGFTDGFGPVLGSASNRRDPREMDRDEEDYFRDAGEETDIMPATAMAIAPAAAMGGPVSNGPLSNACDVRLVPYEEDEDEEAKPEGQLHGGGQVATSPGVSNDQGSKRHPERASPEGSFKRSKPR
ncbi:unnamed protein product [Ostreobium quekettii]|uniref:Serine/threonine-protein phosphatase 4 regulatory subunit 3-like central domain-containing protein n=1 Tax=Ostreobium quekettii TaxID=121088 RepID=A0A8S1IQU0_9CHLO|nr:unnamed protein product [Ostreobium quekettii]|eukprot:evm.model.scf_2814.2 EVM.evm.TU.scf_2814.2   scf_2814:15977-18250(-)